eukprot:SAG11_NODE_11015_length_789_cov_3.111594_1_plen_66_part_00
MRHIRALSVAIPARYFGEIRGAPRLVEFRRTFVPLTAAEAREEWRQRRSVNGEHDYIGNTYRFLV